MKKLLFIAILLASTFAYANPDFTSANSYAAVQSYSGTAVYNNGYSAVGTSVWADNNSYATATSFHNDYYGRGGSNEQEGVTTSAGTHGSTYSDSWGQTYGYATGVTYGDAVQYGSAFSVESVR